MRSFSSSDGAESLEEKRGVLRRGEGSGCLMGNLGKNFGGLGFWEGGKRENWGFGEEEEEVEKSCIFIWSLFCTGVLTDSNGRERI